MTTEPYILEGPGTRLEHLMPAGSGISVVYGVGLRTHSSLRNGIAAFESFARSPGSPLVAPLDDWSQSEARFLYATEAQVTLAEVLSMLRKHGEPAGTHAALNVLQGVAKGLAAVHPAAKRTGLNAHGSLSPWRIALQSDGTPQILGYGLPDTELFAYLDEQQPGVSLDTLRYAPPERLDDQDEDARSDLYTLAIIGAEMMLGRPVFDGTPTSVAERVIRGDAPELIEALGSHLGESILDLLCVATEHSPSERFATLSEFTRQAAPLRGTGPSLAELVKRTLEERNSRSTPVSTDAPTSASPINDEIEERSLVPSVPPLGPSPTLEAVQSHARSIVVRTTLLAEQAAAMEGIAEQRAQGLPTVRPLLRRLRDAVGRAQKAASSTSSTARLVELDDRVDDALITVEMVRSAESLCETATQSALEVLDAIQSEVDDARAEQEMLERARRQATEALASSEVSAQEADEAANHIEARFGSLRSSLEGAREKIGAAREHAESASVAMKRARTALQTAMRQSRGLDAIRDADTARSLADEAHQAAIAIGRINKDLSEALENTLDDLSGSLRSLVAKASSASLAASQSLERATEATATSNLPAVEANLKAIEHHRNTARAAARTCEAEADKALEAPDSPQRVHQLEAALQAATSSAERAQTQAEEASALSDRLISRVGEAARQAAEISKLTNEAEALLKRLEESRCEVEKAWEELQIDTVEVTGRIARDAVQVAQRAAEKVEEQAHLARRGAADIKDSTDLLFLSERLSDLRTAMTEMDERAHKALSRCREARGAASRELDEIAERNKEKRALQDAIDQAEAHATHCREAVTNAWDLYHSAANALAEASLDGLESLRIRAYEIIDIAEFQAGEATSAATSAAEQREHAEALSHARTAANFEERIREDLPEALQLLEQIRAQSTAELEALTAAHTKTADALDAARDALRAIEEMRSSGVDAARDWKEDPTVKAALDQLLLLTTGLEPQLQTIQAADYACTNADTSSEAQLQIPIAEAGLRGLLAARHKIETVSSTLETAVSTARTEIETRENAVRSLKSAVDTVRTMEQKLADRSKRLFSAIELHQASSEQVRRCRKRMRRAIDVTGEAHDKIARASKAVHQVPTAGAALKLQQQVEQLIARVEAALEAATEAETQGVLAAEQEATERVESERRRLSHARTSSLAHLNTAKAAAAKSVILMKEAQGELDESEDPEIRDLHDRAREWVRKARRSATSALGAARRCQRAATADDALSYEAEAASLAADSHAAVSEAKSLLQEATDLARRQEEAAQALSNIKAEIHNIIATIAKGVEGARLHAGEVVEVTASSTDPDTLATVSEAEDLVNSVNLASAKVDAAAPMALEAESVEVAQGLLNTCRHAVERVDSGVDALRRLVQKAQSLLSEEAERAANRLADARKEAERPALEARTIAEKAMGWVTTGERTAEGTPSPAVKEALAELRQRALKVGEAALRAEEAALPARKARDPATARGIGVKVEGLAAEVLQAADHARSALDAVRKTVEEARQLDRDAQVFRLASAEAAAAAELCATDAAAIAEELEKLISESNIADDAVATHFREAKRAAKAIATAAAQAFEQTESTVRMTTLDEVRQTAAEVEEKKHNAERLLTEVRKHDRSSRELLESIKRRSRDDAKRTQDEALRARLRRKRNQSSVMKREELKKQFAAEREEPEKPNLSALRDRLRSRRRPEPRKRTQAPSATAGTSESPRRLGDRPRRRRPSEAGSLRGRPGPNVSSRRRPEPDSSSMMRPAATDSSLLDGGATERSTEEREASRRRRLERRKRKESHSEARPRVPTSRRPEPRLNPPADLGPIEKTQVGILSPEDLQEASDGPSNDPREGADALLRRLRRGRRSD